MKRAEKNRESLVAESKARRDELAQLIEAQAADGDRVFGLSLDEKHGDSEWSLYDVVAGIKGDQWQ